MLFHWQFLKTCCSIKSSLHICFHKPRFNTVSCCIREGAAYRKFETLIKCSSCGLVCCSFCLCRHVGVPLGPNLIPLPHTDAVYLPVPILTYNIFISLETCLFSSTRPFTDMRKEILHSAVKTCCIQTFGFT